MNRELIERIYGSSARTRRAWGLLSARQLRGAMTLLEAAAVAQGAARWIIERGEHALSPEEIDVFQEYELLASGFLLAAQGVQSLLRALLPVKELPLAARASRRGLTALARAAGLPLTAEQITLLDELTSIIAWHERTPRTSVEVNGQYTLASLPANGLFVGRERCVMDLPWPEPLDALVEALVRELERRAG